MKKFSNIKNMNIKASLYISFLAMIFIMLFFAIFRGNQLESVMSRYNNAMLSINSRQSYITQMESNVDFMRFNQLFIFYDFMVELLSSEDILDFKNEIYFKEVSIFEIINLYIYSTKNDDLIPYENVTERLNIIYKIKNLLRYEYIPILRYFLHAVEDNNREESIRTIEIAIDLSNKLSENLVSLRNLSYYFTESTRETMLIYDQLDSFWFNFTSISGFIIAGLLAIFLTRFITKPIFQLRQNIGSISPGIDTSSSTSLRTNSTNEIGQLSNSIADMVDRIFEMNKSVVITDNMHIMIIVTTCDDKIVYTNKNFTDVYNIDYNNYKNQTVTIESLSEITKRLVSNKRANIDKRFSDDFVDFNHTWDNKIKTWISGRISLTRWIDDQVVKIYYIQDSSISKENLNMQKKYEKQLKIALKEAQLANEAKSGFIANTSHEIRTPMNSILGFSQIVLQDDISEQTKKYIEKIEINTKWLLNIIGDIMDFSKIEANKLILEQAPFDLLEMVEHCKDAVFTSKEIKKIDFKINIVDIDNKLLIGDHIKLRQVCINILSNAIKFTEKGYVDFSITKTDITEDVIKLKFTIEDTGIGMTNEQITSIFEPYVQVETHNKYGGTGLGLAISKRIIELMGSTLIVKSNPNKGSVFSFELDFTTTESSKYTQETTKVRKPYFSDVNVLIAEDNSFNQEVLEENLRRCGIKSYTVNNGEEAIYIIKRNINNEGELPFDLIFMDINMPIMNGIEASNIIRNLNVKTPIIATTANLTITNNSYSKEKSMDDSLSKPFSNEELWSILIKYLGEKIDKTKIDKYKEEEQLFLEKMHKTFLSDNANIYERIKESIENDDFETAHRLAHDLKSNSDYIKQPKLRNIAKALEKNLKEYVYNEFLMNALETELKVVIENIKSKIVSTVSIETNEIHVLNNSEKKELIKELEELLSTNNTGAMAYIPKLNSFEGSEELIKEIEDFHFEKALKILYKIKETMNI